MTEPLDATWVLDPWESQALSLRVGRVRVEAPGSALADLTDAWRHGIDVIYIDARGPLTGLPPGADTCFVGTLRELAIDLDRTDGIVEPIAGAAQRRPSDVRRFDLGGRYERDPRLRPLADRVHRRWVEDAASDADREVWTLDDDAGLLVLARENASARIELVGVDRGHRGQGLGSALLRLAMARARAGGGARLVVGGYAHNRAAMRLYESGGLRERDRRWRYHVHRERPGAPR